LKQKTLLVISALCILLSACQKEATLITQVSNKPLGGSPVSTPVVPSGNTYQPVTTGSTWKYVATFGTTVNETSNTITGKTVSLLNGKSYYEANGTSSLYGSGIGYYYVSSGTYAQRSNTLINDITVEMTYLDDSKAIGETWTSLITDDGLVNGVPGRIVGKVLERNINYTVKGKEYTNVVHTQLDLQYNIGGFTTYSKYDFFIAKNIGVIEINTSASGKQVATSQLVRYSIK
jgi:hypothetical protein